MSELEQGSNHHKRELLLANWSICAMPAGSMAETALPEDFAWIPIAEVMPAAAALRELKQWSIDDSARRFDAQDWWYRLVFDSPVIAQGEHIILGFDGLATVAQVWLNGQDLLSSSNMFVAHACDVGNTLKSTGNILVICFSALDAQLAVRRKRPRWRAPMVEHQQLRWFRTTLLGRTPGWSPTAAVVGPWKDIWLERRRHIDIMNSSLTVAVKGSAGIVSCHVQTAVLSARAIETVHLQLARHERIERSELTCTDTNNKGIATWNSHLQVSDIDLWWPHTHGEPALYRASLKIRMAGLADEITVDLGSVGFRTITLDTAHGNFSFKVNDVAVFCRGACWTPLDPVTLRASPAKCYAAVEQARDMGLNMLRVAGTMVYEEDHFFDACDKLGILVWQDFMFANMDYPDEDAAFMASVTVEVRQQLHRIQSRACLAILCGNSEVEQQAAMWGAPRTLWQSALFDEFIAQLCAAQAPGTHYWPSSAHGGSFPHQASVGTTSYYGVGAYLGSVDDARRSHLIFATECLAFANIPDSSTLARIPGGEALRVHHPQWKARSPRDLGAGWDFDDVRDHYLEALFKTDPTKLRYSDHDRYLALGRMATGEMMASSFTEWRRPASPCRGGIVLFLRDLWAGAGWGLIDDAGIPKACYYALKRVLQPFTVLLSDEGVNGVLVHLLNELGEDKNIELEVTVWREGDVLVATGSKNLVMPARSAQTMGCLDCFEYFMDLGYAYRFGPMSCDAIVVRLRDKQGMQLAQAFHFPGGITPRSENDVGLNAWAIMLDAQTAELTVTSKRFAQGVYFDIPGFVADDAYFHLAPHTEVRVTLRALGSRPLSGSVHAVNSVKSTQINLRIAVPDTINMETLP